MAQFHAMTGLVLGVVCLSMLCNCIDDVTVIDDVIVIDYLSDNVTVSDDVMVVEPSAVSSSFEQIDDYTLIVEDPEGTRKKRNAIRGSENYWTGGVVPYKISSIFSDSERRVILQSMKHWEDCTCIRFRPSTNSDIYSIMFMPGVGCRSFIGRLDRSLQPQAINLGANCITFPVVLHEIGHALGFFHEQSRADRDDYIRVMTNNILQGFENGFDKLTSDQATTLNLGYDYASIMHYGATTFARQGTSALVANNPNIPIGDAQELSPLDAAKANRLYNCNSRPLPPPSTIVPDFPIVRIPNGISCGSVIKVTRSGTITSPQFPRQILNEECAFVFEAPEGYGLLFSFPQFRLDPTSGCSEDYVQIYRGASVSSGDLVKYSGFTEGRICNREHSGLIFFIAERFATVYYRTNGRNSRSDVTGLQIAYDQRDIDECMVNQRTSRCHSCRNLPGSFECNCDDGYYHSFAANTCFDVNECAFSNGGCAHTCTNLGGSYRCACNNGFFLQANGLSCGRTRPSSKPQNPTPGTIIPKDLPSLVTTLPPPPSCGGLLGGSTGFFNSPNWPLTYSVNFACEWNIALSNTNAIIEISFDDDFGLGGQMPDCPKDKLILYDGGSTQSELLGEFCHLTRPDPIKTSSNRLTVVFMASSSHGSTRHGFRAHYRSLTESTTPPPPSCGGLLGGSTGFFNSPNWPLTYSVNFACEWNIALSNTNAIIEISFDDDFGLGGQMPDCPKDKLILYDGGSTQSELLGEFCHLTRPDPIKTSSNRLTVVFMASSSHGSTRHGFRAHYRSLTESTTPPPPSCGGLLGGSTGFFNSPNWPLTYSINFACEWNIALSNTNAIIEISFDDDFGLGGQMPDCPKDKLILYDGGSTQSELLGEFCHLTRPDPIKTSSNRLTVVFMASSSHGSTRHGFRAHYRSLTESTTPPPPSCGGLLGGSTGFFNSPNWPLTYSVNFVCEWNIALSNTNAIIEISFDDDFGLGGRMPDCPKDKLILYDGGSTQSELLGEFCHLTRPDPIKTSSNRLTIVFMASSSHGSTRHGFRAHYKSVTLPPPTIAPTPSTTAAPNLQLPQCGRGLRRLTSTSGSLQTQNWPNSPYATNIMCDWDIECPVGTTISIRFEDIFRVAGRMPDCNKDQLRISGCDGMNYGPYCQLTVPEPFSTTCNTVHVTFQAGSDRGATRTGFKLNYVCTVPVVPTLSPQCGGGKKSLTASSGSIQTLNWPVNPYPINTECIWHINCPSGVEIDFESDFRVAGRMPGCSKDQLEISGCGNNFGPFCHTTRPDRIGSTCSKVKVLFRSGIGRGTTRIGFKLNYRCL